MTARDSEPRPTRLSPLAATAVVVVLLVLAASNRIPELDAREYDT